MSWAQLLIAGLIFSRRTQPIAAAGIIGLWLLALRDYDSSTCWTIWRSDRRRRLSRAGSVEKSEWRKHRFEVLRWGVAIALMWSSLEKFAYPDWFYPLVVEKPFLTFGMPRDVFIPMAGVAEFTMGFGLLCTPLVRRLSAVALFIIFNAAVYPFGRVDLIGHALIMAIIVAIAADHTREVHFLPAVKRSLASVPAALAVAIFVFVTGYWGLHIAMYGVGGNVGVAAAEKMTHTPNAEYPHGAHAGHERSGGAAATAPAAYQASMDRMHGPMMKGVANSDPDAAFVLGMIPHYQGAIDMADRRRFGRDAHNHHLAREIIAAQKREIAEMRQWLKQKNLPQP